ncbi:MAG: XRE family transcriptional regulator [Alcaligenaceae bacterium]|nr:MAG: XRE family transcriptional regulator [Alcaligenaceae bacterium]
MVKSRGSTLSVFDDLYPPAESRAMELRSQLLSELQHWVEASGLKQADIAERLGVDQPRVSDIKNGKLSRFTIDKLVEMAARAGLTTRLTVSRKQSKAA